MDSGTQTPEDPPRPGPPPSGGLDPDAHTSPEAQGRPSLSVGLAFARTVRHYFPDLNRWIDGFPEKRRADRVTYPARFLLWYGVLLFAGRLKSRRQLDFKFREKETKVLGNLNRLAGTCQRGLPCNDTLDDWLAGLGEAPLAGLRARLVGHLARSRVLDPARVQGRVVVAVDGTGYLSFQKKHCEHCLVRKRKESATWSHQALEAKALGPAGTVFSLGTEFIDNRHLDQTPLSAGEEKCKQDCELKACGRLLQEIRRDFPQMGMLLTLDALYACGTAFQMAKEQRFSLVCVFKEGSLPSLWQEFQTLLGLSPQNVSERRSEDGWTHRYRWVNELPYTDSQGRDWKLKAIDYEGTGPGGERSAWSWLASADLRVDASTVEGLAWEAGRARWREENQGFNVQKNGMGLEHAFTQKGHFGTYWLLLQVAHLLMQLLEKGSLLKGLAQGQGKRTATGLLGSQKNIADALVESLRNLAWPEKVFAPRRLRLRLESG